MKYKCSIIYLILTLSIFAQSKTSFLADENHSGVFNSKPVASSPGIKFMFKTGGSVRSVPLIVESKLFFGSGDGIFYCVNSENGREIWKFNTGAAINSSAEYSNGKIFFTNKEGLIFCLNVSTGRLIWKYKFGKELAYKWGFDYYTSSPTVKNNSIVAGSGDGYLYVLNSATGKVEWKYYADSRITAKPLIVNDIIYFGDFEGKLYALDMKTQKPKWKFEADGVKINCDEYGFDRRAFVSSPSYADGKILAGNRDGFLYCVEESSGKLLWKFDHKTSWVLSSPAISEGKVFAGSSDKKFVNAVDLKSGKELWQAKTDGPEWASIAVTGSVAYGGDYGGNVFAINCATGEYLWKIKTGDKIHSSPIIVNQTLYIGSDDGNLYAINGSKEITGARSKSYRAAYWEDIKTAGWFQNKTDEYIRDYFEKEGYKVYNTEGIKKFIAERINDKSSSVIILAKNFVHPELYNDSLSTDPVREYLKCGGKVVMLGMNPFAYIFNRKTLVMEDLDLKITNKLFGLKYDGSSTDGIRGWYKDKLTSEGIKCGLHGGAMSLAQIAPTPGITPLAVDETGYYSQWVKNFGGKPGSGLVQLWADNANHQNLRFIFNAAEYGLQ